MNSKAILTNDKKTIFSDELNVDFKADEISESSNNFNFDVLEGQEKEISLNGIKVYFGNLDFGKKIELEIKYDIPFLMVSFELEGDSVYTPKNDPQKSIPFGIKSNQYNFFYMPEVEGTISYNAKKTKYFKLFFSEDYLKRLFKNNFSSVSANFGKALEDKTPFIMFEESQPIPYKLLEIINEIKNCCYEKKIKEVYIHAKIVELFSYLFSELNNTKIDEVKIKQHELDLVEKAVQIMNNDIKIDLTLDLLSEQIGSNKFKLKKYFKLVYGESVFRYQSRLRMEKAKEMLKNSNVIISEVSDALGYKNPQHFTVAFKKKYNCLPSSFKKSFDKKRAKNI